MNDAHEASSRLQEQLGRLAGSVTELYVLQRPNGDDRWLEVGLQFLELADELGPPIKEDTRRTILERAQACGLELPTIA